MQKAIFKRAILCLTKGMSRLRLILFVLLLPVILFQSGCSSTATAPAADNVDANGQPVSSVPWNKPESWETQGQLGGLSQ